MGRKKGGVWMGIAATSLVGLYKRLGVAGLAHMSEQPTRADFHRPLSRSLLTMPTHYAGIVKWYNRSRGFGFLRRNEDGLEVFFHRRDISQRASSSSQLSLRDGEKVFFGVEKRPKGWEATEVFRARGTTPRPAAKNTVTLEDCIRTAIVLAAEGLGRVSQLAPAILKENNLSAVQLPSWLKPPRRPRQPARKPTPRQPPPPRPRLTPRPLLLLPQPLNRRNCGQPLERNSTPVPVSVPTVEPVEEGTMEGSWTSSVNGSVDMEEFAGPQSVSPPPTVPPGPQPEPSPPASPPPSTPGPQPEPSPPASPPPSTPASPPPSTPASEDEAEHEDEAEQPRGTNLVLTEDIHHFSMNIPEIEAPDCLPDEKALAYLPIQKKT